MYYGAETPVQQLASISVPEPRMLLVTPYDKTSIDDILKAINMANLGVNPTSDGNVIRITVPALTEERRKELVKEAKKEAENSKLRFVTFVVMRMMHLKKLKKLETLRKMI